MTVVLPEQFRKRSLLAAAQRAQFRLKLRLLVEPGSSSPTCPQSRRSDGPEGHVPERLVVRVLAGKPDEATLRAVEYARGIGADDLRAVHFGGRGWTDETSGIPVDDAPLEAKAGRLDPHLRPRG